METDTPMWRLRRRRFGAVWRSTFRSSGPTLHSPPPRRRRAGRCRQTIVSGASGAHSCQVNNLSAKFSRIGPTRGSTAYERRRMRAIRGSISRSSEIQTLPCVLRLRNSMVPIRASSHVGCFSFSDRVQARPLPPIDARRFAPYERRVSTRSLRGLPEVTLLLPSGPVGMGRSSKGRGASSLLGRQRSSVGSPDHDLAAPAAEGLGRGPRGWKGWRTANRAPRWWTRKREDRGSRGLHTGTRGSSRLGRRDPQ